MKTRTVFHVDMDYFYAQVEERDNPSLKDTPVAVCMVSAREGSMGSVATCNYRARELGVRSGMPCFQAKKKITDAVFLPVRKEYYTMVSDGIMEVLADYADVLEQVSVDEAYMDVTSRIDFDSAREYARQVKDAVYRRERLTCSVGAGANKLTAKMASALNKPDGVTVVRPDDTTSFLEAKDVRRLPGVGPKTADRLHEMGVDTVRDLQRLSLDKLLGEFGEARGRMLHDYARGVDESPVVEREKKQYGRIASLKKDTRDCGEISSVLDGLASDVHRRLVGGGRQYRTVTLFVVLEDLMAKSRSRTLPAETQSREVLAENAKELLNEFLEENSADVRRVGVIAGNLSAYRGQMTLTDY